MTLNSGVRRAESKEIVLGKQGPAKSWPILTRAWF